MVRLQQKRTTVALADQADSPATDAARLPLTVHDENVKFSHSSSSHLLHSSGIVHRSLSESADGLDGDHLLLYDNSVAEMIRRCHPEPQRSNRRSMPCSHHLILATLTLTLSLITVAHERYRKDLIFAHQKAASWRTETGRRLHDAKSYMKRLEAHKLEALDKQRQYEEAHLGASSVIADPRFAELSPTPRRRLQEFETLAISVERNLGEQSEQMESLRSNLQARYKSELATKYGEVTQRVRIDLVFPELNGIPAGEESFVIELAKNAPHAALLFLDMVSQNLWDGCSFVMNNQDAVRASPVPYDPNDSEDKPRKFENAGLGSFSFAEFDPDYYHQKYTVSFLGSFGPSEHSGPAFYINTQDNAHRHNERGGTPVFVGSDSCFGRVVEGFDAVERLKAMPTFGRIWMKAPVGIQRAVIM